ncbi:MAG: multi-sensor signal transduction histidine kinase [Parcubacteria group bacterium Gr01-1014_48]|nr:MAG: multi-sensor signal transduction histidine kinase [Parcubacteria group bacterium Greene0416_14]TSC74611.1 MAG: multi-sensor signal transduction histidine kinase [Parcubacteria group bacterium Gr01-1014_48]TSD01590.1 MAG: multi-sensor signal transduction histidine kinase [Parcubacteria group bacterium Greene1014_15]TSD08361.1 MAG: multi-sensor signal transduction histidine kinase [Parcubacteria group bacterium Greene0714_4]
MTTDTTLTKTDLLENIANLAPVLASIHESVIVTNTLGEILLANAPTEIITGYMPHELIGKNIEETIRFVGKNQAADFSWYLRESLTGDRSIRLPEGTSLLQLRGGLLPVDATTTPLYGEDGNFAGVVIVVRDIRDEIKVRRRQYEFLSFVSHQLRQPFGTIRWGLELIQQEGDNLTEEHKEMLDDLLKLSVRFANFVNELVDVARFEEGKFKLKQETIDLRKITREVGDELKGLAVSQNISLHLFENTPQGISTTVTGDNNRFHDVFQNLMVNAIRYNNPRGAVTVEAADATPNEIRALAQKSRHSVGIEEYLQATDKEIKTFLLISISDTGLGIPEDQQADMFNNFFRGRNVEQKGITGTGLGLFIIKIIIEGTSGRIFFTSKENVGTTFYIVLQHNNELT